MRALTEENVLGSHEKHTEHFTNTAKSARVDLAYIDRLSLQQLLEYHAIVRVFPSGDADPVRLETLANCGVA